MDMWKIHLKMVVAMNYWWKELGCLEHLHSKWHEWHQKKNTFTKANKS
jgi:hypothetical protein